MFYQDLLSPLGHRAENEAMPQQKDGYRAKHENEILDVEEGERGKDLQVDGFAGQSGLQVPRERLLECGVGNEWGKEIWRGRSVGSTGSDEVTAEMVAEVMAAGAGDETGGLDLEEQREK